MLSGCSSSVEAPYVVGLDVNSATSSLTDLGLAPDVSYVKDLQPEGTVISSTPEEGAPVEPESMVSLVVSEGPDAYVPDVVGQNSGFAKGKLSKLSLKYTIEREYSDDVANGLVISSSPSAGEPIMLGTSVTLVFSKGRKPTLLEGAYRACGYPDVDLVDDRMTIIINTPGDLFMSAGMRPNYDDVLCILNQIGTPDYVKSAIDSVRALDGRQTQEFGNIEISYSYHPDSGIDMTIHDNG